VNYVAAKSQYIALISLLSAFSGTFQVFIAPITFQIIGLPFGHDIIVFFPIILSVWIVRRFGGAAGVGIVSTLVVLFLNPGLFFTIGFAVSSFIFDILMFVTKHEIKFEKRNILAVSLSAILSFYIAGFIIGIVLTHGSFQTAFSIWGPLHAIGGIISLIISYPILATLEKTGVRKSSGF